MSREIVYSKEVFGFNIHRELFRRGFQLNFEGLRALRPRRRYIAVQYPESIREKLKTAVGESGYGTLLTMEDELQPRALLQLYPAIEDGSWFVALAIPRREIVYGYDSAVGNGGMAQLMTGLRGSSFHGPDTDGALFYHAESPVYFTGNPHLRSVWSTSFAGFVENYEVLPYRPFPALEAFIGDSPDFAVAYPPPETKPKTVNEWDRSAIPKMPTSDELRDVGTYSMPYVTVSYGQSSGGFTPFGDDRDKAAMAALIKAANYKYLKPSKATPTPPEPELRSKNGRMIILKNPEDEYDA